MRVFVQVEREVEGRDWVEGRWVPGFMVRTVRDQAEALLAKRGEWGRVTLIPQVDCSAFERSAKPRSC
jgi:hypothetical protein